MALGSRKPDPKLRFAPDAVVRSASENLKPIPSVEDALKALDQTLQTKRELRAKVGMLALRLGRQSG